MKRTVLLFGSRYGTAARYAAALSERTGIPAVAYRDYLSQSGDGAPDTVIYIGALYAGGVLGLRETVKKLGSTAPRRLLLATVGLADPSDPANTANITHSVKQQMGAALFEKTELFFLRGGMDYAKLGFVHKTMMKLLYAQANKQPETERTADTRALIETYGKTVDFVNLSALDALERALNGEKA